MSCESKGGKRCSWTDLKYVEESFTSDDQYLWVYLCLIHQKEAMRGEKMGSSIA